MKSRYTLHTQHLQELINGIHITTTFQDKTTSPGDIYKILPDFISNLYSPLEITPENTHSTTQQPTAQEIEKTLDKKNLFIVFCIAPNTKTIRWHLHTFIYGLHQHNFTFKKWKNKFERRTRREIPLISSAGKPIFYTAVEDFIDAGIRNEGFLFLEKYINKRFYPSLIHYLSNKNSKDFLFHYV